MDYDGDLCFAQAMAKIYLEPDELDTESVRRVGTIKRNFESLVL